MNVTEPAQRQIVKLLINRGKGIGIYLAVKNSGCNGFAYKLEYVDNEPENTEVVDFIDFKVFLDKTSFNILDYVTLDYVKEGLNEGFSFQNSLETSRCGCGKSFNL